MTRQKQHRGVDLRAAHGMVDAAGRRSASSRVQAPGTGPPGGRFYSARNEGRGQHRAWTSSMLPSCVCSVAVAFFALGWLLCPGLSLALEPVQLAVLVGSASYQGKNDLPDLRFVDDDVARFLRAILPLSEPANVRVLLDPDDEVASYLQELGITTWKNPSGDELLQAFAWLEGRTQMLHRQGLEVRAVLFFSAHGDTDGLHLQDGVFPGPRLQVSLDHLSADSILLVADACFSEAWLQIKGPPEDLEHQRPEELFPLDKVAEVIRPLERVGAVTMQSLTREESTLVRGGDLTHEVTSGLLGGADVDQDLRISYDELATWLEVLRVERGLPSVALVRAPRRAPERPPLVMDLRRLPLRGFLFPPSSGREDERYLVRDSRGRMVAELCKRGRDRRRLLLPPGQYQVQRFSPPDDWFGQEGSLEVGEGMTVVSLDRLAHWWQWPDGKGRDARQAPGNARSLSREEVDYATRSRFQRAMSWKDLPGRIQGTVNARAVSGGYVPDIARKTLNLEATATDLYLSSLTREGPALGLSAAVDGRLAPLSNGYLALGIGVAGLASPETTVGRETGILVAQVELVARLGWERRFGAFASRLTGYGGLLMAAPQVQEAPESNSWNRLWQIPVFGFEAAIAQRAVNGPGVTVQLVPHLVLEPQELGGEKRFVPYLSLEVGLGVAW